MVVTFFLTVIIVSLTPLPSISITIVILFIFVMLLFANILFLLKYMYGYQSIVIKFVISDS
ncbi:hypothetical protein JCM30204_48480 [Dysgonomonas termitidis]